MKSTTLSRCVIAVVTANAISTPLGVTYYTPQIKANISTSKPEFPVGTGVERETFNSSVELPNYLIGTQDVLAFVENADTSNLVSLQGQDIQNSDVEMSLQGSSSDALTFGDLANVPFSRLRNLTYQEMMNPSSDLLSEFRPYNALKTIFSDAVDEEFEDGSPSNFVDTFVAFTEKYGTIAINALEQIIQRKEGTDDSLRLALRWLGRVNSPSTKEQRRILMEKYLLSDSVYIRDGAISGIASMRDSQSLEALNSAYEREPKKAMQKAIQNTIRLLG